MEKRISLLRQERERRGWSRSYIAEQIEVDVITVGRWERNERMPHPHHRQKLCALFEKNAEELGLFSEEIYLAKTSLSESTIITNQIMNKDVPAQEPEASHAQAATSDYPQIGPAKREQTHEISVASRRRILIGLGGAGVATLVAGGGIWRWLARSAPSDKKSLVTMTVQNSKRAYQLLDVNLDNWVNRVAWSPENSQLAAANGKNVISIWSLDAEGMLVNYYPISKSWVNDVSWSKENWLAAVSADYQSGSLQVWQTTSNKPTLTLNRSYGLRAVAWSPDSKYLAFAGHATNVEIWDPFKRLLVKEYIYPQLGSLGINRIKWSLGGTYLACAADDGTVHVWEALTGVQKTFEHKHTGRVHDLAWSPDMRYIASAGADKTVQVWEALTGRTLLTYHGHTNEVEGIDWSPQGKYIASGGADLTVQIWEALTGKLVANSTKYKRTPEGIQWSLDGKMVAVATSAEGVVILQSPH